MTVLKKKVGKYAAFASAVLVLAACAALFTACDKQNNAYPGRPVAQPVITTQPAGTPVPEPTATPEPTAVPDYYKYLPVSRRDAGTKFQEYYAYGHAQRNEIVWNEIQAVKAECEELYKKAVESLRAMHGAEFYSSMTEEDFYEYHVKPLEEYYAKKVELLNTVWDTYDMFYATYAMGGNSSGDGALTEEYCQWTEFRYELYCFANPY
ncbi:MAG: PT domain-containing protein [Clostridia bacterium]|nr:PT domain-containing protein [Clostridia bacterium]